MFALGRRAAGFWQVTRGTPGPQCLLQLRPRPWLLLSIRAPGSTAWAVPVLMCNHRNKIECTQRGSTDLGLP